MNLAATVADLRRRRISLGLSQSKLSRLSGVSRFRLSTFELGGSELKDEELRLVLLALTAEASRLSEVASELTEVVGRD